MKIKYTTKRDGSVVKFRPSCILNSIRNANTNCEQPLPDTLISDISFDVVTKCEIFVDENLGTTINNITVEQIEKVIYDVLVNYPQLLDTYKRYNKKRERTRMLNTQVFQAIGKIAEETDRDNANVGNNFSSKLLRISSESNKYYNLAKMDKDMAKLHENGDLYYHDLDAYNLTINCLHINAQRILERTFNTGYGTLNTPNRIESAASLICILLQSSQNDMYGGQSIPNFDTDLAPYLRKTLKEQCSVYVKAELDKKYWGQPTPEHYEKELKGEVNKLYNQIRENDYDAVSPETYSIIQRTLSLLDQSMSGVVYNLNTMHSRAGSQVPFSSLNIGLPTDIEGALICQSFLQQYEHGLGKHEQPIFPNIIFRVKKGLNRNPEDPYYYLFKIACRVASKRMNPTFMNMDSSFNLPWYEKGYIPATMGCRTYLMSNINGEPGVDDRGNAGSTTMNLPRLAILLIRRLGWDKQGSDEIISEFFELLDSRIELAKNSLLDRYDQLKKLKVKDIPFSAGEGLLRGAEDLSPNDSIEPILKHSTWAIGFIGIAETLKLLTGSHHGESDKSYELALRIVRRIRQKTDEFTQTYRLNFSCYATPAEGLSGVFISKDRETFGNIPGITDKGYYTNSYHIPVEYKIPISKKIELEAPFHAMCNGGHISYIELDGTPTGETIEKIIINAYNKTDISYIGINFHIKFCKDCAEYLQSESAMTCPLCGSNNLQGVSRVTGYLGLDERFGYGKSNERKARTAHGNKDGVEELTSIGKNTYTFK